MPRPGGTVHLTWRLHRDQPILSPAERTLVLNVIVRAEKFGARLRAGVIMDDHVHVLFCPGSERASMDFARTWKGESSRLICRDSTRTEPLWQRDSYQRWMRSEAHAATCAAYIRRNPFRRRPGITSYPWLLP